jgi:hypothetical protein
MGCVAPGGKNVLLLKISLLSINEPTPSGLKTTLVSYRLTAEYRRVIKCNGFGKNSRSPARSVCGLYEQAVCTTVPAHRVWDNIKIEVESGYLAKTN